MKTYNWEGVNHDGYFLDKLEPIPSALTPFHFFFNDTATTEIYTLSLHDALPIFVSPHVSSHFSHGTPSISAATRRSEEHTSELQSRSDIVCRLLLEKKKNTNQARITKKKKKKNKIKNKKTKKH